MSVININGIRNLKGFTIYMALSLALAINVAEPIPALDRSSLMLLALLMLGIGFIGMRRIA